ncbi:MAG: alpha/beta fold hydrolase [Vicinamibacterales bacterium]
MQKWIAFGMVMLLAASRTTSAQELVPATYVIVPGMWSGGWDWRTVDSSLTLQGHRVYRITLTGLGERIHLASPNIGLATHIDDVVNTIIWERLSNVILVGHSYGGMVISGVADRIPDRIRRLVYIEAFVPESGESVERIVGPGFRNLVGANTRDGQIHAPWVPPVSPLPKESPHPHRTFTDTLALTNAAARVLPATYVLTIEKGTDAASDGFAPFAARASARGWTVHRMEGDHTPHRSAPEALVRLLTAAAR